MTLIYGRFLQINASKFLFQRLHCQSTLINFHSMLTVNSNSQNHYLWTLTFINSVSWFLLGSTQSWTLALFYSRLGWLVISRHKRQNTSAGQKHAYCWEISHCTDKNPCLVQDPPSYLPQILLQLSGSVPQHQLPPTDQDVLIGPTQDHSTLTDLPESSFML